jgi:hypothetical protein
MVWAPLSWLIAVLYAFDNNIVSYLSHYGFSAREIQAPGAFFANIIVLVMISIYDRKKGYLNWFYEIYWRQDQADLSVEEPTVATSAEKITMHCHSDINVEWNTPKPALNWPRIWLTLFIILWEILEYWLFTLSYYYATLANLNNGVIMTMYALKPIISSVLFHFLFKQKLQKFEVVGIGLWFISACWITLSTYKPYEEEEEYDFKYAWISLGLIWCPVLIICFNTTLMKYYLAYDKNQVNVSAFYNFSSLINDTLFLGLFFAHYYRGFDFTLFEFLIGQITGSIWSLTAFLRAFVNLRGKAGTSDALIETCVIYQTILDAFFFGRIPNALQILGVWIGFSTSIILVFGYVNAKNKT